ncbi:hypothetical protein H2200_006108 [Cladophialophora chaetospira]|uniref:C2H2-type domain-containing protein n=1 Tax=Cladophialophora chaetospira TaxID=386627 RepID=A0AA39CIZ2_9EURO|nr:hypothetical protein H2200_006108 [Cladophialophora chaetospira]
MAELAFRGRDQPDIRARISIHDDESPNDIKELLLADQTQRALRSKHSWTPPEAVGSLHRAALRKARTLPYPYRPGHFSDIPASDALPCPIDRSNSLNSLSTIQRETEAASLSLYRGSPISAIGPSYTAPSWTVNIDEELQDPCPPRPLRVETLSQQRKIQKRLKKSMKKQDKEQLKAQKEEEHLRRAFLAAEVADARRKDAAARGETIPLRTKSTKSIASQVVKSLSLRSPLSKLSRRVRGEKADPPTLDDFDSKSAIREYLNPSSPPPASLPATSAEIAELPAELPQYTPFQDLTRTQDNEPPALLEDANPPKGKDALSPFEDTSPESSAQPKAKSMRCDSCQSPIRLNQVYYHCSTCDNGDRILCSSCDQAGLSCRHDLTEKVRNVSRPDSSEKLNVSELIRQRSRTEAQQYAAAMWGLKMPDASPNSTRWAESPVEATISAASPWAYNDIVEQSHPREAKQGSMRVTQKPSEDARELDIRQREQQMALREKEIALRERETSMREQQTSLKEQEATLHVKQQMFSLQLQATIARQMSELSTGVGAQFQDLSEVSNQSRATIPSCEVEPYTYDSPANDVFQHDNIRTHATKRKAGTGRATISPSNSTGSAHKPSPKRTPSGGHDPDEEDDDVSGGSPKKIKQDPDAPQTPEKLFACPFCKYDKSKYSEQNVHEKQYRGCSSGYWPDISRLKQHLYRVHWRRTHCTRCYTKFDKKEQLDQHRRAAIPCMLVDCPYPEKFHEAQYNDIRRKRPASTPEQVWYTIYSILFPGLPQPVTPYADNVDMPSAVSPAAPETQDTMEVLTEVFESRLDQLTNQPGQGWLQSSGARQLIREQLRASMTDVLRRMRPTSSPYLGNPSVEVSPISAGPPDSARRSSICLTTPASSIPPSPVHGSGSTNRSGSDSQFLLPGHRQSFSRPFSNRTVPKLSTPQPPRKSQNVDAPTSVVFPVPLIVDPENDNYDEECHSWSHGDEHGLAISTDSMPAGFNFDFAAAFNDLHKMEIETGPLDMPEFVPVKLASLDDPYGENSSGSTELKSKHSTTSSVDSGYGSLGHASSSASATATASAVVSNSANPTNPKQTKKAGKNKGKRKAAETARESSPVPESAINYDALEVPFQDFSGINMDLNFDEHLGQYDMDFDTPTGDLNVNMGAVNLSAFLDRRYSRGVQGAG